MRTVDLFTKCSTAALVVAVLAGSSGEVFAPRQRFVDEQKAKGNWKDTPEGQRGKAEYEAKQWMEHANTFISSVRGDTAPSRQNRQEANQLLTQAHSFAGKADSQTNRKVRTLMGQLTGFKNGGHFDARGEIVLPASAERRRRSLDRGGREAPTTHQRHSSVDVTDRPRGQDAASRRASFASSRGSGSSSGESSGGSQASGSHDSRSSASSRRSSFASSRHSSSGGSQEFSTPTGSVDEH